MHIDNLKVPPFNTTLMGVVRGVADYFDLEHSDAMLFGGTGHAFLINIHAALCPSGPYCWKPDRFRALLANLGVEMTDHGFFSHQSGPEERARIEAEIKSLLDRGTPCSLLNMENQLITGHDEAGFDTSRPWPQNPDFPPGRLSFGTWEEQGEDIHMSLFSFSRRDPAEPRETITASLECGADIFRQPERYTDEPYGAGARAYDKWIGAVEQGHGNSHGNWWNGTVWGECRHQAAAYLREVGELCPEAADDAAALAEAYDSIAGGIWRASDKELADEEKLPLLRETRERDRDASEGLGRLAEQLAA